MLRRLVTYLIPAFFPVLVRAQIPEKFSNLQFFPKDIARDSLIQNMRGFSFALGVRCQYCHSGGDGRSFEGVDFASDAKVQKQKARQMLEIARRINGELLSNMPERRSPRVVVECATCHRGLPIPRTLTRQLELIASEQGGDSAVAFYRRARTEHSMDGVYDFGEWSVNEAARTLVARGKFAEAVAILEVNVEHNAQSASAVSQLAGAYEAAGNNDKAIQAWRRVLSLTPNDRLARQRLTALGAPPPP
jgi:hypothetical protein